MAAARYELEIDAAEIDAIDMHVHLEVDSSGHGSLPDKLTEASTKYFKAEDRAPSLDRIAEVYRELKMAAVVFTVGCAYPTKARTQQHPRTHRRGSQEQRCSHPLRQRGSTHRRRDRRGQATSHRARCPGVQVPPKPSEF